MIISFWYSLHEMFFIFLVFMFFENNYYFLNLVFFLLAFFELIMNLVFFENSYGYLNLVFLIFFIFFLCFFCFFYFIKKNSFQKTRGLESSYFLKILVRIVFEEIKNIFCYLNLMFFFYVFQNKKLGTKYVFPFFLFVK